jgi:proteasome lid subunit RPN8/RPN11
MWEIKKTLIEDACKAAENYYPDEFLCFFGGKKEKEIITEIVLLPTYNSEDSTSISEASMPIDDTIVGCFHSHPNGANTPSQEDKKFFKKYGINAIVNNPFNVENTAFYNQKSVKITVKLV